ncbi:MAG: hypothetical protein RL404_1681 [Pseudomonadota bacterium]
MQPTSALAIPRFRWLFFTFILAMMADSVEHVISYWVMYQKFESHELGGFAVLSHWLPYLFLSIPVGALTERFDPRRMIQCGMVLFMLCSLGWGWFFISGTLQMWQAMVLLVMHGVAGVIWLIPTQLMLYYVVEREGLPSAIRLVATARYLGLLSGPGVGAAMLLLVGPETGILINVLFYLPTVLWLARDRFGPKFAANAPPPRAFKGMADIVDTIQSVSKIPVLWAMIALAGLASFFIGNSYHAQMPSFAQDLGHGDPGVRYGALLGADACGALLAGLVLERVARMRASLVKVWIFAIGWCVALGAFALTADYGLAVVLLFAAGFCELSFSSMAQTLTQLNAPETMRGRVVGLFNMSSLGLRSFAGVTVGLIGGMVGVHQSLAGSALALVSVVLAGGWLLRVRGALRSA